MSLALPAPDGLDGMKLSPVHKAAVLMMVFGEDTAAQILRTLSPTEVQTLGEAMYTVQGIDHETVDAVLNEFLLAVSSQTGLGIGASVYVRDVLDQALGTHKAQSVHNHMADLSMVARMHRLITNLESAVESEDLSRIACADHALRNEVIAIVGGTDLMQHDASERVVVLNDALVAVRHAIEVLVDRSAKQAVQKNAKLIYLNTERTRKRTV